jgi:hypothetical protein
MKEKSSLGLHLVIPAHGRWKQVDHKFKAILGYTVRHCQKTKNKKKKKGRKWSSP